MTNKELWEIANRERLWLTAEEFYAHIEAHRAARLKEKQAPRKPFQLGRLSGNIGCGTGIGNLRPKLKLQLR
jgi:hypothetical protein